MHLDESSIKAGLGYCRWLSDKAFCDQLNARSAGLPIPKHYPPIRLLPDHGKRVYAMVAKKLSDERRGGGVMLQSGEIAAVRKFLADLKDSKVTAPRTPARAPARGPIKHAKLQLSSIEKFVGSGKRVIRGLANSGLTDRVGDIVVPKGGRWDLPVPLLWQHKHDQPIGWVRKIDARSDGLHIEAELAVGIGKADEAWAMVEAGLVDSYSIGFQGEDWEPLPGGGKRFTSWSLLEISIVTIPADARAKIRRNARTDGAVKLIRARQPNRVSGHPGAARITRRAG